MLKRLGMAKCTLYMGIASISCAYIYLTLQTKLLPDLSANALITNMRILETKVGKIA